MCKKYLLAVYIFQTHDEYSKVRYYACCICKYRNYSHKMLSERAMFSDNNPPLRCKIRRAVKWRPFEIHLRRRTTSRIISPTNFSQLLRSKSDLPVNKCNIVSSTLFTPTPEHAFSLSLLSSLGPDIASEAK